MKNLPSFEQFVNEAQDFSDITKYFCINPEDSGVIRKNSKFRQSQGMYVDTKFGRVERQKLINYIFEGIKKKYKDAELIPNDQPYSAFTDVINYAGNKLRFSDTHMNIEEAKDFQLKLPKIEKHIKYIHSSITTLDKTINIEFGDLDRIINYILEVI
jgi:hypothetical protein